MSTGEVSLLTEVVSIHLSSRVRIINLKVGQYCVNLLPSGSCKLRNPRVVFDVFLPFFLMEQRHRQVEAVASITLYNVLYMTTPAFLLSMALTLTIYSF